MADKEVSRLPPPSAEDQRVANGHFEYANRAMVGGNYDIAIGLLRSSCKLVPGNLSYRQALRKAEKSKYKSGKGSLLAPLTTWLAQARLMRARRSGDHRKVLEYGEAILARDPWHKTTQLYMADAAAALGLSVVAIWILQQAREKDARDVQLNRALARLLEQEGHFNQAIQVWELVRRVAPQDREAQEKMKQLAVTDTIARGAFGDGEGGTGSGTHAALKPGATPAPATKKAATPRERTAQEIADLRARIEADPSRPEPYLRLGTVYARHGHTEEARKVLEQGLEATGQAFELALALADLEIEPLRRTLARAEDQLRSRPDDEKLLKGREKLLRQINAREMDCLKLKAEHDPSDRTTRFELGVRLLRAGQAEEAIPEFQAVRSDPRLGWKALHQLGLCFKARNNWPLARRNFEEALKATPEAEQEVRKELLYEMATGHAGAGDLPAAIELALDLANLDYGYRNIGRLLEEWQERGQKAGR